MLRMMIEVPEPKQGRHIYVPSNEYVSGGLGTIYFVKGKTVMIQEARGIEFNWEDLVRRQVELVGLFGRARAIPQAKFVRPQVA